MVSDAPDNGILGSLTYPPRERTPLDIDALLTDVQVPEMEGALAFLSKPFKVKEKKMVLFGEKKRKAWDKTLETRCDFQRKVHMTSRAGCCFFSLWQKSVMGRTLTEIKSDEKEIDHFAKEVSWLVGHVIGSFLREGGWCIVTTPKRRHLTKNFATLVAEEMGHILGIPFYEDVATCKTKQRINAVFNLQFLPPEKNIILFDDFVTTGSTLKAMSNLLMDNERNVVMFTGINNKL
ncbi:MAG: phosphoribosyltransferase [Prevotella sp.]|nr:phosphoribosyltransferase [Prevotella sp.]